MVPWIEGPGITIEVHARMASSDSQSPPTLYRLLVALGVVIGIALGAVATWVAAPWAQLEWKQKALSFGIVLPTLWIVCVAGSMLAATVLAEVFHWTLYGRVYLDSRRRREIFRSSVFRGLAVVSSALFAGVAFLMAQGGLEPVTPMTRFQLTFKDTVVSVTNENGRDLHEADVTVDLIDYRGQSNRFDNRRKVFQGIWRQGEVIQIPTTKYLIFPIQRVKISGRSKEGPLVFQWVDEL